MNVNDYVNKVSFPRREDFKTTYWYYHGGLVAHRDGAVKISIIYDPNVSLTICTREDFFGEKELAAYNSAMKEYRDAEAAAMEQFQNDLFKEIGIENHPNRFKLFQKAWDRGHSSGYSEVMNEAWDLVDLIK